MEEWYKKVLQGLYISEKGSTLVINVSGHTMCNEASKEGLALTL